MITLFIPNNMYLRTILKDRSTGESINLNTDSRGKAKILSTGLF